MHCQVMQKLRHLPSWCRPRVLPYDVYARVCRGRQVGGVGFIINASLILKGNIFLRVECVGYG